MGAESYGFHLYLAALCAISSHIIYRARRAALEDVVVRHRRNQHKPRRKRRLKATSRLVHWLVKAGHVQVEDREGKAWNRNDTGDAGADTI